MEDDWRTDIPRLLDLLKPGAVVRVYYGPGLRANRRLHIRAIVDEEQVVYRVWQRRWQDWRYKVEWLYSFWLWDRDGKLRRVK